MDVGLGEAAGQIESFARGLTEAVALTSEVRTRIACRHRARVNQRADLTANLPRLLDTLEIVAGRTAAQSRQLLAV